MDTIIASFWGGIMNGKTERVSASLSDYMAFNYKAFEDCRSYAYINPISANPSPHYIRYIRLDNDFVEEKIFNHLKPRKIEDVLRYLAGDGQ